MNSTVTWYQTLMKPSWAPPSWVFSPVWFVLYCIIIVSYGYVFFRSDADSLSWIVMLPFVLNLVFNFAFTPLQFGLRNNLLASIDVFLVLVTLLWVMVTIYPLYPWVALVNIPYLVWVCFATALQFTITYLNS